MKKIILISLILSFVYTPISFGFNSYGNEIDRAIFIPLIAEAQDISNEQALEEEQAVRDEGLAGVTSPSQNTSPPQKASSQRNTPDCSGPIDALFCAFNKMLEWVAAFPIVLTGFLVQMTGTLLNFAVTETVLKLGSHIDNISGINSAWGTLRDLANIFFIFGLLAIAISTIIGLPSYGYKKLLAKLIIVALLINFSMFFTKFIIDTSNVFSYQFYKATIVPGTDGEAGIANAFIRHLGVTSMWETEVLLETLKDLNHNEKGGFVLMFTYAFFVSVFFSITAFVFVFAAIMLITRAAGLIFLIILSPLAFAAMILPNTQRLANEWWGKLWQYAIFAPILMILFWVTVSIIPDIARTFGGGTAGLLDTFSSDQGIRSGGIVMVFNFIIIISFILASIIIANKMSILGSEKMTKIGSTIGGLALRGAKTVGITWPRRRFATLAAEVESGKEKRRRGGAWNPMHYIMKAARPAGKAVMKIPGAGGLVRQGLQATAATYKADVAARQSELEKYSSKELVRRLSVATLPINRNAIAQVLQKKEDLDELSLEQARSVHRALKNSGASTNTIEKLRPDALPDADAVTSAVMRHKPKDVGLLHKIIVDPRSGRKDDIVDSMIKHYHGGNMSAVVRRGDEVTDAFMTELIKRGGGTREAKGVADYLRGIVTTKNIEAEKSDEKKQKLREQQVRNESSAKWIETSSAQRLMGLTGETGSQRTGTTVDKTGMSKGERHFAQDAEKFLKR